MSRTTGTKALDEGIPSSREVAQPGDVWAWQQGRRVYVACPKESALAVRLKELGLHWDWEEKARWCSSSRAAEIVAVVVAALPEREAEREAERARIAAAAEAAAARRAQEAAERAEELTQAAQSRPIFRKLGHVWWLVGRGLEVGQRVEVTLRTGGVRVVRVTHVSEHDPAAGLVQAAFRDWTTQDDQEQSAKAAGHAVVVDFQADTWGTPRPQVRVGDTRFVDMGRREQPQWRVVIEAETTRWQDADEEWGERTRWVLAEPTPQQTAALEGHLAALAAHRADIQRVKDIAEHIRTHQTPFTDADPATFELSGPMWCGEPGPYGDGAWFVIDEQDGWIWAVTNNGRDGDDWRLNNVSTDGAGAIGARIAYDPDLAEQIRELHEKGAWLYRSSSI